MVEGALAESSRCDALTRKVPLARTSAISPASSALPTERAYALTQTITRYWACSIERHRIIRFSYLHRTVFDLGYYRDLLYAMWAIWKRRIFHNYAENPALWRLIIAATW